MKKNVIFDAIVDLFNWIYEVRIRSDQRAEIEQAIKSNWNSADTSDQELVGYLLELYDKIFTGALAKKISSARRDQLRPQAQRIFKKEFSRGEVNERGRILSIIYTILEQLRPGCTQVSHIQPQPIMTTNPIHPTQTTQNPSTPAPAGPYYHGPQTPVNPANPNPQNPLQPKDAQSILMDAKRDAERATLESQLEALRHQTTMAIIRNI